jgi:hypothetical protein
MDEIIQLDDECNLEVAIDGDDYSYYFICRGKELVSWNSDEIKEDNNLYIKVIEVSAFISNHGCDKYAETIRKIWNGTDWIIK